MRFLGFLWVPLHLSKASFHLSQSRWALSPQLLIKPPHLPREAGMTPGTWRARPLRARKGAGLLSEKLYSGNQAEHRLCRPPEPTRVTQPERARPRRESSRKGWPEDVRELFPGTERTPEGQVIHRRERPKKKVAGKFSAEHPHFTPVSVTLELGICYNLQLVSFLTDTPSHFPFFSGYEEKP